MIIRGSFEEEKSMISIILFILAIWLFIKFIGFIFRLSWGLLKIGLIILGILLWPVSIVLLISLGLAVVALPVILICGVVDLIGKAIEG